VTTKEAAVPSAPSVQTDRQANHARRWWILAILGIAQLMVILDSTVINIALPTVQRALKFSNADRQWIVTGYSLAFGSLLLLGGRIGDFIGRKSALVIGLVGFAGASALGGASTSFAMLVTARTIQGAFAALLAPSVLALLTTSFRDPVERGKAFAIYGAIAGAGGAIGLLLGGVLTSYASWRWTLFVNLFFAAAAVAGSVAWLRNDRAADHDPFDVPGVLTATWGLFCLVYGLSHAEITAWSNPWTIALLVVGVLLLACFALIETKVSYPLLPMRIVLDRTRGGSLLTMLFAGAGLFGYFLFVTYYLQVVMGFSAIESGLAFLPMVFGLIVTAQISIRILLPRFGPRPVIPVGLLLNALAMMGLHTVGLHSTYALDVMPFVALVGIGAGLSISVAFSSATLGLPSQDAGVGSAAVNTAQQVGGSIGTALLNTLAASAATAFLASKVLSSQTLKGASLHSYTTAFEWTALLFALGAVISALTFKWGAPVELSTAGAPAGPA
jgi:EmrB/QacA subfamily drug resistance transporter